MSDISSTDVVSFHDGGRSQTPAQGDMNRTQNDLGQEDMTIFSCMWKPGVMQHEPRYSEDDSRKIVFAM